MAKDPPDAPEPPKAYRITPKELGELNRARRKLDRFVQEQQREANRRADDIQRLIDTLVDKYDPPWHPCDIDPGTGEIRPRAPETAPGRPLAAPVPRPAPPGR
jgi:hypothetical protein